MNRLIRPVVVLLALLMFGALRWPVESAVTGSFRSQGILQEPLSSTLRDQLSQNAYVAAFGGFRSVIASLTALQADVSWQNKDWGDVEQKYEIVTALQPQEESYWEAASWHMAYNAAPYYLEDWHDEQIAGELRREYWKRYIERGQEFLADGLRYNPGSWKLWKQAGMIHSSRYMILDHAKAAEAFAAASQEEGAPEYLRRRAVYELSYVQDKKSEAMTRLQELYLESPRHHTPVLLSTLLDLQLQFRVPMDEMVPISSLGVTAGEAAAQLNDYRLYRESLGGKVSNEMKELIKKLRDAANSEGSD